MARVSGVGVAAFILGGGSHQRHSRRRLRYASVSDIHLDVLTQEVKGSMIAYPGTILGKIKQVTANSTDPKAAIIRITSYNYLSVSQPTVRVFYDAPKKPDRIFDEFLSIPALDATVTRALLKSAIILNYNVEPFLYTLLNHNTTPPATIGAGGFGYANYKFEEPVRKHTAGWLSTVKDTITFYRCSSRDSGNPRNRSPEAKSFVLEAIMWTCKLPALRACRKVDLLGLRAIGVVTKMDVVPPDQGVAIAAILYILFTSVSLPNPLKKMTPSLPNGALIKWSEKDYFSNHREYFGVPSSLMFNLSSRKLPIKSKFNFNESRITTEDYVAQTVDALKAHTKDLFALWAIHKPEVRAELKAKLDDKVMDVLEELHLA
ncbi:hypothetical protein EV363DRAFT_1538744 [Boletus edulis]|nr:hypothetical protein EV363DRAFT_1538744 [Boletus edulis]